MPSCRSPARAPRTGSTAGSRSSGRSSAASSADWRTRRCSRTSSWPDPPIEPQDAARGHVESIGSTTRTAPVAGITVPSRTADPNADASPNSSRSTVRPNLQQATAPDARETRADSVAVLVQDADDSVPPLPSRPGVAAESFEPAALVVAARGLPLSTSASAASATPTMSPWTAAADAGVAVGTGAQDAAVATAGFFNRFGRKIADSF